MTATTPVESRREVRADADAGDPGPSSDAPTPPAWRRVVAVVAALAALAVAGILLLAATPSSSQTPLSPDSAEPDGARAAAQILTEQGVRVTHVTTTAAALAEAEAGSTLLVAWPNRLGEDQRTALADVPSDVVLVGLDGGSLEPLTDRVEPTGFTTRTVRSAGCEDPDAIAAEQVLVGGAEVAGVAATGGVDATCFGGETDADGAEQPDSGAYAVWTEGATTWRVLTDATPVTNEALATAGNAALVLRALGQHDRLVWYVPDPTDTFTLDTTPPLFPVPDAVVLMIGVVAVGAVLWQARRLGPVVVEPLPVVVRASETTRGRGRLYRRAGAHAHAGAALRAGLIARVAGHVGIAASAEPAEVVERLARASGRPPDAVGDLLYGPPPTDDSTLEALTRGLDTLESEVIHR